MPPSLFPVKQDARPRAADLEKLRYLKRLHTALHREEIGSRATTLPSGTGGNL